MISRPDTFLSEFTAWAETEAAIDAVALVGSRARGIVRADSDVDLVILATDPAAYVANTNWVNGFGTPSRVRQERYGTVQSLRVVYTDGLEVEFGFGLAPLQWATTSPVDEGTREVVRAGAVVLVDKSGRLGALMTALVSRHP